MKGSDSEGKNYKTEQEIRTLYSQECQQPLEAGKERNGLSPRPLAGKMALGTRPVAGFGSQNCKKVHFLMRCHQYL